MSSPEFEIIKRYFSNRSESRSDTRLGMGDDCALLSLDDDNDLALTIDTLVEGVHFFPQSNPNCLGHKVLAVSLSDLAAMGAKPSWAMLAITLPRSDVDWLEQFSKGFFDLARSYSIELIGGDTTEGPLTVSVQAMGVVPKGRAILRSAAKVGDLIYITGFIGDAALGLKIEKEEIHSKNAEALRRLHKPEPRVDAGLQLRGLANACIDISDGLVSDLGHILDDSGVGAVVTYEKLPLSSAVHEYLGETGDHELPIIGGDDYELCFTVQPMRAAEVEVKMAQLDYPCTCIGTIEKIPGLRILKDDKLMNQPMSGYEHFS